MKQCHPGDASEPTGHQRASCSLKGSAWPCLATGRLTYLLGRGTGQEILLNPPYCLLSESLSCLCPLSGLPVLVYDLWNTRPFERVAIQANA